MRGGFDMKGKKEGDLSGVEARDEIYLREGVTKKNYSDNQQTPQSKFSLCYCRIFACIIEKKLRSPEISKILGETDQNKMAINSLVSGRSTNYPELYVKSAHESEFRVHFYVTNVSTFFPKMEVYTQLYDALQTFGETKEIAFQKGNEDSYNFVVGMKEDKTALEIIDRNKLSSFLSSFERGELKPSTEIAPGFKAYVDVVIRGDSNKRQQESHSHRYPEKGHEKYSHRDGGDRDSPRSRKHE